jgi:hypothetical protein
MDMKRNFQRADFMNAADRAAMGNLPRTHHNCISKTGKQRPGKTACERARRLAKAAP